MKSKITMKNKCSLTLGEAWDKFKRHCKVKNLAEVTIDYYKLGYEYLLEYFDKDYKVKDIEQEYIEELIEDLMDNNKLKKTSINTKLRAIRRFLYFYMDRNYLANYKISLLKVQSKQKRPYTDGELEKLLEKPDMDNCIFSEYRNWVNVNFLLGTGVRLNTLIQLKVEDISLENAIVDLRHTKNRKQRIIPLSKSLVNILFEYLDIRKGDKGDYLFCTIHGKKLQASSIKSAIYRYNTRRGVETTSIHKFRHTFAKKWILNGGDAFRLQKILGHSSMKMVREYVNMYDEDLKENFNDFNPLEEFNDDREYIDM